MVFDSSVRKELARAFGATLVVVLTIVWTMMLVRTLNMAAKGNVAPQDVVLLLSYLALGQMPTMLALSLFVAIVVTLGRMYRGSEMVIWFASGVSLARFVRPVLRVGTPVLVVIGLLALVVWPWTNRQTAELRTRYEQRTDVLRVAPGLFQSSSDGRRVFFIEREAEGGVGRNVFLVDQQPGRESLTTARAGRLEADGEERWVVLDEGHRTEIDPRTGAVTRTRFEVFRMWVDLGTAVSGDDPAPRTLDSLTLLQDPKPTHLGELTWRVGLALAAANMLLLGIATAASNPRRASNWNLLAALLAFVIYYNLINLSQAWVTGGRVGMGQALLMLHGGVFVLACAAIWWRTHGSTMALPWRRSTRA